MKEAYCNSNPVKAMESTLRIRSIVPLKISQFLTKNENKLIYGLLLGNQNGEVIESFEIGCNLSPNEIEKLAELKCHLLKQTYPQLEFIGYYSNDSDLKLPAKLFILVQHNPFQLSCMERNGEEEEEDLKMVSNVEYFCTETDKICISQCLLTCSSANTEKYKQLKQKSLDELATLSPAERVEIKKQIDKKNCQLTNNQIEQSYDAFSELHNRLELIQHFINSTNHCSQFNTEIKLPE